MVINALRDAWCIVLPEFFKSHVIDMVEDYVHYEMQSGV